MGRACRYDLKQLFIGAEGTLGVVTGVAVQCPPRSSSRQVAVLAVPSFRHAQQVSRSLVPERQQPASCSHGYKPGVHVAYSPLTCGQACPSP